MTWHFFGQSYFILHNKHWIQNECPPFCKDIFIQSSALSSQKGKYLRQMENKWVFERSFQPKRYLLRLKSWRISLISLFHCHPVDEQQIVSSVIFGGGQITIAWVLACLLLSPFVHLWSAPISKRALGAWRSLSTGPWTWWGEIRTTYQKGD